MFFSAGSDCQYKYTKQPRHGPICNPYITGTLKVECAVQVPVTATDISIGWSLNCNPLTNDANITIVEQVSNMTSYLEITSRLTIVNLSDDYTGKYVCSILGSQEEEFISINLLDLKTSLTLEFLHGLSSPCPSDLVFSRVQEKCAELTENNTIPVSLSCADPVIQSTAFGDVIMTTVIQTTTTSTPTPTILPLSFSLSPHRPYFQTPPLPSSHPPPLPPHQLYSFPNTVSQKNSY